MATKPQARPGLLQRAGRALSFRAKRRERTAQKRVSEHDALVRAQMETIGQSEIQARKPKVTTGSIEARMDFLANAHTQISSNAAMDPDVKVGVWKALQRAFIQSITREEASSQALSQIRERGLASANELFELEQRLGIRKGQT